MATEILVPGVLRGALQKNLAAAVGALALATTALGLLAASPALAVDPKLCRDDNVTEVPPFASGRDANQCLRLNPGNGDADVLIQYETFHRRGGSQCAGDVPMSIKKEYDSCSTKLSGQYCTMLVWDTVIDNYSGQDCKNKDGVYYGEGTALQHYLIKDSKILNTWKCTGKGWSGPNGISCPAGEESAAHTDGIQLRGNPSGGGWWVMQDSEFLNGFNLHFLHQVGTKWGENGSVMFQNVRFGRARNVGHATDYIQDCFDRGVSNNLGLCNEGFTQIGFPAKEYWFVNVYGTAKMRPTESQKIVVVNTGCGENGCGGNIAYANGWPHPLHCGGDRSGPGTCPNGPIGSCSAAAQAYCYTSLEEAAQDHKLPPFAQMSSSGWKTTPGNVVKRPATPELLP